MRGLGRLGVSAPETALCLENGLILGQPLWVAPDSDVVPPDEYLPADDVPEGRTLVGHHGLPVEVVPVRQAAIGESVQGTR